MKPRIIIIAGVSSNCGKTTLVCDLLRMLAPAETCEAIKLTRGHYRSCGKDPHACCVSFMLGDLPIVRSGRDQNYASGKDTGRYWDAGASDVHWVISTSEQVEDGMREALSRVKSNLVLIEGTSPLKFLEPDYAILVTGGSSAGIKPAARKALLAGKIDAIYSENQDGGQSLPAELAAGLPVFSRHSLPELVEAIYLKIIDFRSSKSIGLLR